MRDIRRIYHAEVERARGRWCSYVTMAGVELPVIDDGADTLFHAASTNKVAMAVAVLAKVDRGELGLGQRVELIEDAICSDGGAGIYHLQTVYGDQLTLANVITALLLASDNSALPLIAGVLPAGELNRVLASLGFERTRVEPDTVDGARFFHGWTTPREMHALLSRLGGRTLLSPDSCEFLLNIMTWSDPGYTDGVRRDMSSRERRRVATKYGAYEDERHEVGLVLDDLGRSALVYAFFADGLADGDDYGATHPAVRAHAVLGRALFDAVSPSLDSGSSPSEMSQTISSHDGNR